MDAAKILEELNLKKGPSFVADNLLQCYEALVRASFYPQVELELLTAWLNDCRDVCLAPPESVYDSIDNA